MKTDKTPSTWKTKAAAALTVALAAGAGSLIWKEVGRHGRSNGTAAAEDVSAASVGPVTAILNGLKGGKTGQTGPAKAVEVLRVKSAPVGAMLGAPGLNPDADKGRVVKLDGATIRAWARLQAGSVAT